MKRYHRIVVGLIGLLTVAAVGKSLYEMTDSLPAATELRNLPVIVIDPGHGGIDGGAVGVDEIVEKNINLAICLTLRDMLAACGFDVVMTRETDISIHDEGITSARQKKTSDLRNRLSLVNSHPSAVFVSVHQNKFEQSSSKGTQVFFSPNNDESERLAAILQKEFVANLQPENTRQTKKAGKNLFLMYNAKCPAVLVECGFLSNAEEARRLSDPAYQNQIAFTILGSVIRFLELDAPALDAEGVEALYRGSVAVEAAARSKP